MTTAAHPQSPSLIIPSGQCSVEWLWATLDKPWFGDLAIVPDGGIGRPAGVRPVHVSWLGREDNGGLS